jgi:hypothetical protein
VIGHPDPEPYPLEASYVNEDGVELVGPHVSDSSHDDVDGSDANRGASDHARTHSQVLLPPDLTHNCFQDGTAI